MKVRQGLRALLLQLSDSRGERSIYAGSLSLLIRSRKQQLLFTGIFLPGAAFVGRLVPKFYLWAVMARILGGQKLSFDVAQRQKLRNALSQTSAYIDTSERIKMSSVIVTRRSESYAQLADQWLIRPPQRLFVFHHYDHRGYFPDSWFELLLSIRDAGWTVLISSSNLAPSQADRIHRAGFLLAIRENIALCLGAYKDICLLLNQSPGIVGNVSSLVLANDSTIPVLSHDHCLRLLESWISLESHQSRPILAGLTDSAERGSYHIQSFFLYANSALLRTGDWIRFWHRLSLQGTKDQLINRGEIGLSQAMLSSGVQLLPAYPLMRGLLRNPAMSNEIQAYKIYQPRHVNQSLFAWQSLVAQGCPLVKKHVLFELIENQGLPMAIADLARLIPEDRHELIAADLHELFISRYCSGIAEIG